MKLNRKWILVLSLVLSVAMATSGTLAYLMDTTQTEKNIFTLGNVDISLDEPKWKEATSHELLPSKPVPKDPTITNDGWHDAWVWMDVVIPAALYEHLSLDGVDSDWTKTVSTNASGDKVVTLKYQKPLASGEKVTAFDSVTLSADAKFADLKELGSEVQIDVTAYGIETASFTTVDWAYAAFNNDSVPAPEIPDNVDDTTLDIIPGGNTQTGTIIAYSAEDLLYLGTLSKDWVATYSNGQGTEVSNYRDTNGGKGTDYYYHWTWTIELGADIDFSNKPIDSIATSYWGNFDGKGHKISNVVLNKGQTGLFDNMQSKQISNLTVENISVDASGVRLVGALSSHSGNLTNVHLVNASVKGGAYTGGLIGKGAGFTNCSIKNATVTGTGKSVGSMFGYSIGDPGAITVTKNLAENVNVTGAYNVGGLVGHAQNGTFENNTVKNVTVTSTSALPADASSEEKRTGEVAARIYGTTTVQNNTVDNVVCAIGVSTAADLSALSAKALTGNNGVAESMTINIMNDIDMKNANFSAIIAQRGDKLIINGNGHTISNVKVVSGDNDNTTGQASMFYAYPNSTLEVSNLKLKDITVTAEENGSGYAAAIAGYCEGTAKLTNVDVENATVTGVKSSGMLIGHLSGTLTAKDCDLSGTVTLAYFAEEAAGHYAGKYIGTLAGPATLTGCTVNATVSGNLNAANLDDVYGRSTAAGSLTQN